MLSGGSEKYQSCATQLIGTILVQLAHLQDFNI